MNRIKLFLIGMFCETIMILIRTMREQDAEIELERIKYFFDHEKIND